MLFVECVAGNGIEKVVLFVVRVTGDFVSGLVIVRCIGVLFKLFQLALNVKLSIRRFWSWAWS